VRILQKLVGDIIMDVKTAGRTVDLFEIFAQAKSPLTLSEIARALNAPQSSCFNLVRTLEARGYLYSVGGGKRMYPTRKLLDLTSAISDYEPVIPRVEPLLEALHEQTKETVLFGARQGDHVIYLKVLEGSQTIRYISRAGELKPLYSSAIGKALLMGMDADARSKLVRKLKLKSITQNTLTSADDLLHDILRSEQRGFAMTRGENVVDVMAVACPISIEGVTYAIAVAGPINRVKPLASAHAIAIAEAIAALD
jgi:IclR family transcriptional regulator, acetate operon repressor